MSKLAAHDILSLLLQRHSGDVCVTECKDGPTQVRDRSHRRMDLWVMPKSWSQPACTAYEIKASRSDFIHDDKWPLYLDLCHQFYFVCPTGLIQPEECPEQGGLMWVAKTGTRIYTKKKAPLRDVTIPETLWRYVLMRSKMLSPKEAWRRHEDRGLEYWKEWLTQRDESESVGREVRTRMGRLAHELLHKTEMENLSLKSENEGLQRVKTVVDELGINLKAWDLEADVRRKFNGVPVEDWHQRLRDIVRSVETLERDVGREL